MAKQLAAASRVVVLCALGLGVVSGCSSDLASMRAGEACTRSAQCQHDLVCRVGVCRAPSSSTDDAGQTGTDDDGGK